jgi:hypothetical protein
MKLTVPSIRAYRTALGAKAVPAIVLRPVNADGETPLLWADCVGYEAEHDSATADDQDLLVAIEAGERSGKIRQQDRGDKVKLAQRLATERDNAKKDREGGKGKRNAVNR